MKKNFTGNAGPFNQFYIYQGWAYFGGTFLNIQGILEVRFQTFKVFWRYVFKHSRYFCFESAPQESEMFILFQVFLFNKFPFISFYKNVSLTKDIQQNRVFKRFKNDLYFWSEYKFYIMKYEHTFKHNILKQEQHLRFIEAS